MGADAEVETLLAGVLDEVLVGANAGGLEGLGAQLLILVGDEVDAEREVVDGGTLAAKIEDANLGVGDTTVEARLGVRLGEEQNVSNLMRISIHMSSPCFPTPFPLSIYRGVCSLPLVAPCLHPTSKFLEVVFGVGSGDEIIKNSHLVLAVAVATSGTASHLVGFFGELSVKWLLVTGKR